MVLENLLNHVRPRAWWKAGEVHLLAENEYNAETARLDIEYTFVSNGNVTCGAGRTAPTRIASSWDS
jgi:hypothetical protein